MWSFEDYYARYLAMCKERNVRPFPALWLRERVGMGANPADAFTFYDHQNMVTDTVEGIDATLAERGARYGSFKDHAAIAQDLQDDMRAAPGWNKLAPDQKQALSVIADKIARMLNGDPDYLDNWHDIIGYAKLVEDRLKLEQQV